MLLFASAPSALAASYVTQFSYDASGHMRTARTVDTDTDPANCGAIGRACGGVATECNAGQCGRWIGGFFIDPMADVANCGEVARTCTDAPENGYATCASGRCGFECYYGYDAAGSTCVDTATDPFHCGAVGNVCDGAYLGTATCSSGKCGTDTYPQPVVEALNGVASGTGDLFRSAPWKGLVVTGHGLEHVTWVEIEAGGQDAGDDTYDADGNVVPGSPTVPLFSYWYGSPYGDPYWVAQDSSTITIDAGSLWPYMLAYRQWYRLRLHYGDWYGGDSAVVDVPFSIDYPGEVDLPAPQITGVSLVRYVAGNGYGYDARTGCIPMDEDPTILAPAPTALVAYDGREFPVLGMDHGQLCGPPGLPAGIFASRFDASPMIAVEWDDTFTERDVVSLEFPAGRVILHGENLVCDDGFLTLVSADGEPLPGWLQYRCLLDRIVVDSVYDSSDEWASVQLTTNRGTTVTSQPLRWRGVPEITRIASASGPISYVQYGQAMTIEGRWFVDPQVTFSDAFGAAETLAPAGSGVLGANQFRVLDDKHIEVLLSLQGGKVPRALESWCDACGRRVGEASPGTRYFTVSNPEQRFFYETPTSYGLAAIDPDQVWAPPACPRNRLACQASDMQASAASGTRAPISQSGTGTTYVIPSSDGGQDLSGRVGAP